MFAKTLLICLVSWVSVTARADWNGTFELRKSSGDDVTRKCPDTLKITISEDQGHVILIANTPDQRGQGFTIKNHRARKWGDQDWSIGYHRSSGTLIDNYAYDGQFTAALGFGFVPMIFSDGVEAYLASDGQHLSLRHHRTIYFFGKRAWCEYDRANPNL